MKTIALIAALIIPMALGAQEPKKDIQPKKDAAKKAEKLKDEDLTPEDLEKIKKYDEEKRVFGMRVGIFAAVLGAILFVNFIPVFVAYFRGHPNLLSIFMLQFLLSWVCLPIVWSIAMIWACSAIDIDRRYR